MSSVNDTEGFAKPWLEFEKHMGERLILHGPLDDIFKKYEGLGALLGAKCVFPTGDETVKTEDMEISPGLKVRVYTPPNYVGNKPVCVFFHGGGWAMGDLDAEDVQVRSIAKSAGIIIVSVDYRLAPAHKFPAQLDDGMAAYHWALKNAAVLKTTPNKTVLFGTSAGGNLALGLALKVIDEGHGETLQGVVAVMPPTVSREAVPDKYKSQYTSYDVHAEHTIDSASAMKAFADAYGAPASDPYGSPLLHTRIKDLRRVYLVAAEMDTLRDDARLMKLALDEAGVPNKYDEYSGYPHWFFAFPSEHLVPIQAEYDRNLQKGFEFVLG